VRAARGDGGVAASARMHRLHPPRCPPTDRRLCGCGSSTSVGGEKRRRAARRYRCDGGSRFSQPRTTASLRVIEESPSPSSLPTYPSSSSSPPSSPPIPHYVRRRRYGWEDGSRFARLPSACARTASRSEWGRWRCGGAHCVRSPACSGSRRPLEELGRWGVRAEMRDAPHGYGARVAVERDRW
jgi:hypothetical protein